MGLRQIIAILVLVVVVALLATARIPVTEGLLFGALGVALLV